MSRRFTLLTTMLDFIIICPDKNLGLEFLRDLDALSLQDGEGGVDLALLDSTLFD